MNVKPHVLYVLDEKTSNPTDQLLAYVGPASPSAVMSVLKQDENDPDGRSPWCWIRLQNGDLVLATFPQGAAYEAVENDAAHAEQLACDAWKGEKP